MGLEIDYLVQSNKEELARLEAILGYRFTDLRLLQKALIHSSYAFEHAGGRQDNEKLEFLGDAVLDLIIGHMLLHEYEDMREGELTRLRSSLVNEHHLAEMAKSLDLGDYLALGKGEDASQGRYKTSILSCAFEAVIGGVFEDGGYGCACEIVEKLFRRALGEKKEELLLADSKSRLQELLQEKHSKGPSYVLDNEEGPSHKKIFTVSVCFEDEVLGTGQAGSKKEAEQRAASRALTVIEENQTKMNSA